MARLFTAIELGAAVREAVAAQQQTIAAALRAAGDRDLRLVKPEHLHLTLVFIGEVPGARVTRIASAMAEDVAIPPFDIEFGSTGVFPPRGAPRVLWCGVERGVRELTALHGAVSTRLEALGIPREQRPFQPHLTVGRWRDRGAPRMPPVLPGWSRAVVARVEAVTLFSSRLLPVGPEHTAIAQARLT